MNAHIITIFPESFESYFSTSIIWRSIEKRLFNPVFYKLNNYSTDNFKRVDSKAYWMHWQVMSAEPLSKAIDDVFNIVWKRIPVIYMTPRWVLLKQSKVEELYSNLWNDFIIICGHYEWIDQRIIDLYVDYEISIWEYVISSWELSATVLLDALVRHIPEVLWNVQSLEEDSYSEKFNWKKEYPVYTRPQVFNWLSVPEVLVGWNHKLIEEWKNNNLK